MIIYVKDSISMCSINKLIYACLFNIYYETELLLLFLMTFEIWVWECTVMFSSHVCISSRWIWETKILI